ncbi:MAG: hypothetical protein ACRDRP_26255, partial [Pseudonocardiaceae bacterium]
LSIAPQNAGSGSAPELGAANITTRDHPSLAGDSGASCPPDFGTSGAPHNDASDLVGGYP